MTKKIWKIKEFNENNAIQLHDSLKINKILCEILVARNINTFDEARDFFRPQLSKLHDPFLMKDMDKAVIRIQNAINNVEPILIYGDYDVDGTTSVAVVYSFLKKHLPEGYPLSFYIPNRYKEGYGVSSAGIEYAIQKNIKLIITLDCGIKATEHVLHAKENGIDFIVADHHLPDAVIPNAVAILNPKQTDCPYPFKELSGCGIGFKLISALANHWKILDSSVIMENLDLVAASIASDIVPMVDENRILAFYGLIKANDSPSLAIEILKETSGVRGKMTINNLVFMIGPRINAAGRMDDAKKAVELLISNNKNKASALASLLHADNQDRIDLDRSITHEALELLENPALLNKKSTVLYQENWHKGVVGIVASRVIEHHYKPTIILTLSNGNITGSARSVYGFDIHKALCKCEDLLISFGGHQYAAGLTLSPDNLERFVERFETIVTKTIQPISLQPIIWADAEIELSQITNNFLNILEQFEPCGPENMAPIFITRNVRDNGKSRIVKDTHLQLHVEKDGVSIKGIAFGMASHFPQIINGQKIDIIYHIEKNEWNGIVSPQLRVLDIQFS